jgi:hypothetical protein
LRAAEGSLLAAEVEHPGPAAQDRRDDPGPASQPPDGTRREAVAGVELGDAELLLQVLEAGRDDDAGVGAAGLGEQVGWDAFEELDERLAHPLRTRLAQLSGSVGGSLVLGGGDRGEHLAEDVADEGGELEPAVGGAVAVVGHRQPVFIAALVSSPARSLAS